MPAIEVAVGCSERAAGAVAGFAPGFAISTSAFTTRPRGPVPLTALRSIPFCSAIRRAKGDAKTRCASRAAGGAGAAGTTAAGGDGARGWGTGFAAAAGVSDVTADLIDCIAEAMSGAAVSPSPSRVAMGALTFTPSAPSGTSSLPIRPSSTASNSIVALSVSISARMSPDLTVSPSLTSHLASLPSSIVGESAGMRICVVTMHSPVARVW